MAPMFYKMRKMCACDGHRISFDYYFINFQLFVCRYLLKMAYGNTT